MLSEEVGKYLNTLGLGVFTLVNDSSSTIYVNLMPEQWSGIKCAIGIFDYAAGASDSGLDYDTHGIQVRVRGYDQSGSAPYALAKGIHDALHGFTSGYFIGGGTYIVSCLANHVPAFMGQDENRRHEFVVNFTVDVQNTARLP